MPPANAQRVVGGVGDKAGVKRSAHGFNFVLFAEEYTHEGRFCITWALEEVRKYEEPAEPDESLILFYGAPNSYYQDHKAELDKPHVETAEVQPVVQPERKFYGPVCSLHRTRVIPKTAEAAEALASAQKEARDAAEATLSEGCEAFCKAKPFIVDE